MSEQELEPQGTTVEDATALSAVTEGDPDAPQPQSDVIETQPVEGADAVVPPKKDGVQTRINELTGKLRRAERDRALLLDAFHSRFPDQQKTAVTEAGPDLPPEPKEVDFDDYTSYVKATGAWAAKVELAKHQWGQEQTTRQSTAQKAQADFQDWISEGEDKAEGFGEMVEFVGTRVPPHVGEMLRDSEKSHELVKHLFENPKTMKELIGLPPTAAMRRIIKLEERLSQPPQKTETKAPANTSPVDNRATTGGKTADLEYGDFKAARERELGWRT